MNARSGSQAQSLRSMNMNTYGTQQNSRQVPRLQNTQKTGLGNGNAGAGWAFGAPSGSAFGSLGGAPGLGQARPGQLSGFAQVMGGGGGQGPIDMSDFPSLAGGPRQPPNSNNGWGGNINNVIRQPPIQQQAPQQPRAPSTAPSHQSIDQFDGQRSQQQSNDRGSGDDYPLSANLINGNGNGLTQTNGLGSSVGSPEDAHPHPNGQQSHTMASRDTSYSSMPQAPIGSNIPSASPDSLPSQSDNAQSTQPNATVKRWADMTEQERYGMQGYIARVEAGRAIAAGQPVDPTLPTVERNWATLQAGVDINNLGLDLDSTEPIYKTFHVFPDMTSGGSFDSSRRNPVPDFQVPPAYYVNNVPDSASRMAAFADDTLFNIFYFEVRDVKQELAAIELANREWRYHKVIRQWIKQDCGPAGLAGGFDHTNGAPGGILPVRLSEKVERGIYLFFNNDRWSRERKEFTLDYDCLWDQRIGPIPGVGPVREGSANAQ
ncbi:General negative regulator of transcription subunit 2 [Fulvia fulva]|uniref:General negative regulator of transcription subunit 2 n=1 Tax=Passalora fulva TaxID=5499 RepID=A0A9Q8P6J0_PASFU|nr:General negative regulator of transcription subunit 2 [Fulvia fulva]KAK4629685.1 General negative regulator of transcription subunit 2 [Fulvia fulva]KAK4630544.1 General negative regulator of transcription subunit 2 [Fulvia fulva]UJO14882.1 General negative regulator of transcription subunit 2 [Fulvia fulva]WPV12312.1 General negative regulator of transcription subunit 2 [Fulvia fulva]WPV27123.1 General negative regulator of transcription subunit 2 [Fulvia fulva]